MELLKSLNDEQRAAVEAMEGPSMIIAGAGSGKTRVITYKIAYLMSKGVDPFNILALTFTNKAAREMRERVEKLLGTHEARNIWLGTFHSVFARVLRAEAEKLGFTNQFTIYDTDDTKSLIKSIIKEKQLDDKQYKVSNVLSRISNAKINLISPIDYGNNPELLQADREALRPLLSEIYTSYQERLRRANAMDFDDLLFNMNVLLRAYPDVLHKYQKRFKYILVDEYQDTNFSQYLIIKKLAADNENICVVGDDAQSIYAFRGANIQNILNFERDYPDLRTFKLEQNYRSTKSIVGLANSIIKKNQEQLKKTIWTENDEGEKITLIAATTDNEEGNKVARKIFDVINHNRRKYSEFAVLYRTNAQSRAIEEALRRMNMPYKIFGGLSFYKRKEIKDLLSYFRLAINKNDEEALWRVINLPKRGIGESTIDRIKVFANDHQLSIWESLKNIVSIAGVNQGTVKKIGEFVMMIEGAGIGLETTAAYEKAMQIAKASGYLQMLYEARDEDEGVMRFENVEELLNGIKDFSETVTGEENSGEIRTLPEFMQDIALYTDAEDKDKQDGEFISLMTIHAAKGLEFPFVFVVGLEENLFPSLMSLNSRAEIEEERRLFYVAVTRGEKMVFLSYARMRYNWGKSQSTEPSRFIEEIDKRYINDESGGMDSIQQKSFSFGEEREIWTRKAQEVSSNRNLRKIEESKPAITGQATDVSKISVGSEVFHQRFGRGKVLQVEGTGDNTKATVFFGPHGTKNLILKFAKLEVIG